MTQMTPAEARVIDPILTAVAQGYRNSEFVGGVLFPTVPVGQRGGKILTFGREDFKLYNTARAPGTNVKRTQFGHAGAPYALSQHALEGSVPIELQQEAQAVPGIDLGSGAIRRTQDIIALRLEKAQADLATNAANYGAGNKITLAGTSQWSDYASSDPTDDINTAVKAVRAKVGRRPRTVVIGADVFDTVKYHPQVLDRLKYTGRDTATPEMLAQLWNVGEVRVGDAVYVDEDGNQIDVWGKNVVVAFTQIASAAEMGLPSYGYTYRLRGYPIAEPPYNERQSKAWIYPVTDEVEPVIASADAGYLISAAVA